MCMGGSAPDPLPPPAQAAPVTSQAPEFAADMYENETQSETGAKKRKGKKALRISRNANSSLNIPGTGSGSGLNV